MVYFFLMDRYIIHFDGSCWPNPGGTAAYGFAVSQNGMQVASGHDIIATSPKMSNNVAEFMAAAHGLAWVRKNGVAPAEVTVIGDSQIVVHIMNGKWRAKQNKLYSDSYVLADNIQREMKRMKFKINFKWIPREENQSCDDLSKAHLTDTKQTV